MEVPVSLITGFLDGGKTTLIKEMVEAGTMKNIGKTLLLSCENGEERLTKEWCEQYHIEKVRVKRKDDLTFELVNDLVTEGGYDSMIVEYNGMWELGKLYHTFPEGNPAVHIYVQEKYCCIDALTLEMYYNNMGNMLGDKVRTCDEVIIHNVRRDQNLDEFNKMIRRFSGRAKIKYVSVDGDSVYDQTPYPPVYNIEESPINVYEEAYAYFCHDVLENPERYDGKAVTVKGLVFQTAELQSNEVVFGRNILEYSIHDGRFMGMVCEAGKLQELPTEGWVQITGKIQYKYHEFYEDEGPVLELISWEKATPARQNMTVFQ